MSTPLILTDKVTGSDVVVFLWWTVAITLSNREPLTWGESIGVNQDLCFWNYCVLMNNFLTTEKHCFGQRVTMSLGHFVFAVSFCVMCCVVMFGLRLEKCIATVCACGAQPFKSRCNRLSLYHSGVILSRHGSYWQVASELG